MPAIVKEYLRSLSPLSLEITCDIGVVDISTLDVGEMNLLEDLLYLLNQWLRYCSAVVSELPE